MRKFKPLLVCLMVLLTASPFLGSAAAQNAYTYQSIVTNSATNFLGFVQGIGGWYFSNFSEAGRIQMGFDNVVVNGIYNASIGVGSFRNLGSVTYVNIQPNMTLTPSAYYGQSFSENNRVSIDNYNYAVNMSFNGFKGAGIVVLNVMAGSLSNQFTSVTFNLGRNAIAPASPSIFSVTQGNPTVASLTNNQMQAIAATANNDIQVKGKQTAVTTVQGAPDVQGVCAMTLSAGVNNLVNHRVEVNIDTSR
ncbi:MAG: hypothetical protein WAU47_05300 [Desulfobaccales bacterium]